MRFDVARIERELAVLVGLPLCNSHRAADLLVVHFGALTHGVSKRGPRKGQPTKYGEYALHGARRDRRRAPRPVLPARRSAAALRRPDRRHRVLAAFQIGRDSGHHIRVDLMETSGDFFTVEVHVAAGAFAGAFRTDLVSAGLAGFRDGLRALHERLSGTATLTGDYERMLQIEVTGDGRGHMSAGCDVTDAPAFGARLQFSIDFDQTEMPATLAGLDSVLATLGRFQAS